MPLVAYKVDKGTPVLKLRLQCLFHDKGNRVSSTVKDRHDGVVLEDGRAVGGYERMTTSIGK